MIMCVLLCYPVSIRIYYQQGILFLVRYSFLKGNHVVSIFYLENACDTVWKHGVFRDPHKAGLRG